MIQTYLSKCCEPCGFVSLTFPFKNFSNFLLYISIAIFYVIYDWINYHYHYGTGEHEHNTVNMLCSLKKLSYYKSYLAIMATSLQGPLSSVPKVAIVERFDCIQNVQNINVLIS